MIGRIVLACVLSTIGPSAVFDEPYEADVAFALDALEEQCGDLLKQKEVDWKGVRREFAKLAKDVESPEQHRVLLTRLLARVKDGHAAVVPAAAGKDVGWPAELAERWESMTGPGMFWCTSGKRILVKSAWNAAEDVGIEPGMEVVKVDGVAAAKWLDARVLEQSDMTSFSTPQQALYHACHWGLAEPRGTRMKLELKSLKGKKVTRTLTFGKAGTAAWGPAFLPAGIEVLEDDSKVGKTPMGYGYIHVRRVKDDLPERMDAVLAKLAAAPGLILDFRANGGGGCDHDALLGRFIPAGTELQRAGAYALPSAGPNPYGGPIVVLVDAGARSAGETASGMFKEDGRAYMIGEAPTAGMSAQKTTIELPSRLFDLYVATHSNKGRFNEGRGIEGIGVIPHGIVEYDQKDLAAGVDTLIRRAEELLADFPAKEVPYDPAAHGWTPPD
jgi:C-terminal processing protease CtpA/Prc